MAGSSPQTGQVLNQYRLLEKLGEGGMGVVWLAEDTRLGRKVAIKFLPPEAARDATLRQRLEQEARAAAALTHPGIATVYAMEESADELYLVFEYVRGHTLRAYVKSGGVDRTELLDIAGDVAEALAAAHAAGIVHRDLKPENVMRTPEGGCKILDFGLARLSASMPDSATLTHLTTAGTIVGTVGYMSPEQLDGKEVDSRSDVFSFGAMVYELATGVHPFATGSSASTIAAIMTAEPVSLMERNRLHPPELERIVCKCLRKRRDERYQSTRDLVVDLHSLKHGARATTAATAPPSTEEEENLFNIVIRRVFPTPRRWWEVTTLKLLVMQFPAIYLAWRIRQVAVQDWAPAAFLAMVAICIAHGTLRAIMVLTAAAAPRELPQRVRSFQPWHSLTNYAQALLWMPLTLMLGFDRYPLGAPLIVALGVSEVIWGVTEPMLARQAFPQAFAPKEKKKTEGGSRVWWWQHQFWTMFASTPLIIWLLVQARPAMPTALRQPLFFLNALALGLHWSVRFALVSSGFGNPAGLEQQVARMRPWIRWTGWPVVAGLGATALSIAGASEAVATRAGTTTAAFSNEGLAAIMGALAMGGVACLVFLDPMVERTAFPGAVEPDRRSAMAPLRSWFRLERTGEDPAAQAQRKRFREIAGMQLIMATLIASLLLNNVVVHPSKFWARAMDASAHAEPSEQIAWLLGYSFALVFLISVLVASVGFAVRAARGEMESVQAFHRFFWLYYALDQVWVPGILFAVARTPVLAVALPLVPVVALLPFFQRRRAREILAARPPAVVAGTAPSA